MRTSRIIQNISRYSLHSCIIRGLAFLDFLCFFAVFLLFFRARPEIEGLTKLNTKRAHSSVGRAHH